MKEMTGDRPDILHRLPQKYDTGWINRSDWTNVHLGSTTTKNVDSNVAHNLGAGLDKLLVKILISTDGTDANSFEVGIQGGTSGNSGITVFYVDDNTITVQTGSTGLTYHRNSDGNGVTIDVEDWYYKIVAIRLFA